MQTLLLNDEIRRATLLLQSANPTEAPVRETEAVAGCNCDRWGHPCPGCVERNIPTGSGDSDFHHH